MSNPKLTSSTKITSLDIGMPIELTFDQPIIFGDGNVVIRDLAEAIIAEIPVNDPRLTISGNKLILNPGDILNPGWRYNITLTAEAITNSVGEAVAPGSAGLMNVWTTVPPFRNYGSSAYDTYRIGNIDNHEREYNNFIGFDNSTDDFEFTIGGTSRLEITIDGLIRNTSVMLFYNGGANYPGWETSADGDRTIIVDNLAPGHYVLDVRNYSDFTPYNLSISAATTAALIPDAGSTYDDAKPLEWRFTSDSGSQFLSGQIGATLQKAYYSFTVDTQTRLALNVHSTSAAPHLKIVQDRNGNNLLDAGEAFAESLSDSNGGAYAETELLSPGKYFFYAESGSGLLDAFDAEIISFNIDNIKTNKALTTTLNGEISAASDISVVNRVNMKNSYIYNINDLSKNISIGLISNGANIKAYDDQGGYLGTSNNPGAESDTIILPDLDKNTVVSTSKKIYIEVIADDLTYKNLNTYANTNYKIIVTEVAANENDDQLRKDVEGDPEKKDEEFILSDGGGAYNVAKITIIRGGAGKDDINLSTDGNTLTLSGIETLTGGSGPDVVTLGGTGNTISLSGVETLTGSSGFDVVTLSGNRADYSLTRSAGGNARVVDSGGATMVLSGVERLAFSDRNEAAATETWQDLKSGFTTSNGATISQDAISPITDPSRGTLSSRVMLNGAEINGVPSTLKKGWKVGALADTDGDGKTEIFFFGVETVSGVGAGWGATWELGSGNTVETTQTHFNMVKQGWEVVGTSNINGVKGDEILWQNTLTGDKAIWTDNNQDGIVDGGFLIDEISKSTLNRVCGVSDIDQDGLKEIIIFDDAVKNIKQYEISPLSGGDITASLIKSYDDFSSFQGAVAAIGVSINIFPVIV